MKRIIMALVATTIIATPAVAQWHQQDRGDVRDRGPGREGGWDQNTIWQGAPDNPYQPSNSCRIASTAVWLTEARSSGSLACQSRTKRRPAMDPSHALAGRTTDA